MILHIFQGCFTDTGAIIDCRSASEATMTNTNIWPIYDQVMVCYLAALQKQRSILQYIFGFTIHVCDCYQSSKCIWKFNYHNFPQGNTGYWAPFSQWLCNVIGLAVNCLPAGNAHRWQCLGMINALWNNRSCYLGCLLTLTPVCVNNYTHCKVWDEITYPFANFDSGTIVVWEWLSNFIPHFTRHVITYPCW